MQLADLELVPAAIKPRVYGSTLDNIPASDADLRTTAKAAVAGFIEQLVLYSASREPAFFLNDFKLSNLMWGRTHGETTDHLILIDVNCFDGEGDLLDYQTAPDGRKERWANHYAMQLAGRSNAYNWTRRYECFEFQDGVLAREYMRIMKTFRTNFPNAYDCPPTRPPYPYPY